MQDNNSIRKLFLSFEEEFFQYLINLPEYKEILNRKKLHEKLLLDSINDEQFKLYDNAESCHNELVGFKIEEAFIKGFKTAYELLIDSLK